MASFFIQTRLTKAVYACNDELVDLARSLLPETAPAADREEVERKFMTACEKTDCNSVNAMLEEYLLKYMGASDIFSAFYKYCYKFGITEDLTGMDIPEIVKIISSHADEINAKLAEAGC